MFGVGKWCVSTNNSISSLVKYVNPSKYSLSTFGWCDCSVGVPPTVNIGAPALPKGTEPEPKGWPE